VLVTVDGAKLRELRIRKGWTREVLSVRSGVSERAIQDIEKGVTPHPRPNTVLWLAGSLEVTPESLWLRSEPRAAAGLATARPLAVVLVRDLKGTTLNRQQVTEDRIHIGRDAENDVVLPDAGVSLYHALLVLRDQAWELRDLGSANGTYVSGQLVSQPQTIKPGETIGIVPFLLELRPPSELCPPNPTLRLRLRPPL